MWQDFLLFLRPNNIPFCVYSIFCLSIHPSEDMTTSPFWLWWIVHLALYSFIYLLLVMELRIELWALDLQGKHSTSWVTPQFFYLFFFPLVTFHTFA
jgi:hypothetical protein